MGRGSSPKLRSRRLFGAVCFTGMHACMRARASGTDTCCLSQALQQLDEIIDVGQRISARFFIGAPALLQLLMLLHARCRGG